MKRLKVGDVVQVITGKNKGDQGPIKAIAWDDQRVIVEGVKMVTKHQKPNARSPEGGKVQIEAPIHISNVMPIDPTTKKPTRVKFQTEDGKKQRIAKSGAQITS